MVLIKSSEPSFMTAEGAAQRKGYAARSELALRNLMEAWLRARRPKARMCHEMVMGARQVRADLVAVDVAHIIAVEIKGEHDDTTRLLHQVGMYQLCVPEVWMVVPYGRHTDDAKLIRHLLPSVGLLVGNAVHGWESSHGRRLQNVDAPGFELIVEAEAVPREPVPEMMLEMLWAAELAGVCDRTRTSRSQKPTRPNMIKSLLDLPADQLQYQVCIALRARDALWRADTPIDTVKETTNTAIAAGSLL